MNDPTPGSTSLCAIAIAIGSLVISSSAPAVRNARAMLATFATGKSMSVVFMILFARLRRSAQTRVSVPHWPLHKQRTAPNARVGVAQTLLSVLGRLGSDRSNHTFGRWNVGTHHRLRLAQRDGEGFENRLGRMVSVAAADQIDVDVARALVREGLEELLDQRERKIFVDQQHFAVDRNFEDEVRTAGEIDDHARERFVEWHVRVTEAADTALVAE